jgi:uncharacterized protein
MKILFYLAHPAHFHLFKNVIVKLNAKQCETLVTIKKKDVLEQLLKENGLKYYNVLPTGRKNSRTGIFLGLFQRGLRHLSLVKRRGVGMIVSSAAEMGPIARLVGIPFVNIFEDDLTLFPIYTRVFGPFINSLVVPASCRTASLEYKTIKYDGYQELAYLAPKYFTPDYSKVENYFDSMKRNFLIRFAQLSAWHDTGVTGLNEHVTEKIIEILEPHGRLLITSEVPLHGKYEQYRLSIPASDMHHALYFADMYIGDSQTMTAEAAVLGTPSLRFNDFVGKLGYLEELEHRYALTYGIKTSEPEKLFAKVQKLLKTNDLKAEWKRRRAKMLGDKVDVVDFISDLLLHYKERKPPFQKAYLRRLKRAD